MSIEGVEEVKGRSLKSVCVRLLKEQKKFFKDMNEYDSMKRRGYTLMKNDKGDDFWVGYGD